MNKLHLFIHHKTLFVYMAYGQTSFVYKVYEQSLFLYMFYEQTSFVHVVYEQTLFVYVVYGQTSFVDNLQEIDVRLSNSASETPTVYWWGKARAVLGVRPGDTL